MLLTFQKFKTFGKFSPLTLNHLLSSPHIHSRNGAHYGPGKVRLPRYVGLRGEDPVDHSGIKKQYYKGDQQRFKVLFEKPVKNQVGGQSINESAGANMDVLSAENPDEDIGNEIAGSKNPGCLFFIKKIEHSAEYQQRHGIGQQVYGIAMNKGGRKNAQQPYGLARQNAKNAQIPAIVILKRIDQPHQKHHSARNHQSSSEHGLLV